MRLKQHFFNSYSSIVRLGRQTIRGWRAAATSPTIICTPSNTVKTLLSLKKTFVFLTMWCYLFPFVWLNKAITLKIALCALLLQELCTQERQEAGGALTSKHKISNCWHCSHHWASFVCSGEGAIWSNALTQIISFHLFSRPSLHQVKVDELREQYTEPICSSVRPFLLIIYGTSICWSAFPPTVAPERSRRSEQLAHQLRNLWSRFDELRWIICDGGFRCVLD